MDIQLLKKKIPHGAFREIASRCGVHYVTICNFYNKKKPVSQKTQNKILSETVKYLQDMKMETQNLTEQIQKL
ncbi:hypothetical protein [Daejeonia sp. YH14]|uniref:hypothetical protein n=1 Tax=Daejeonia sp. YH14 TaxID=3439042 RepID=UPI003F491CBB